MVSNIDNIVFLACFWVSFFYTILVSGQKSETMAPVVLNSHQIGDMSVRLRH